ncbi:hypothetical protein MalM25_14410 [Planctomycetes bacterium MalM25]|nr:hypothetical protein MalM25_14410 [Planctomycetes bacterium MalM25]
MSPLRLAPLLRGLAVFALLVASLQGVSGAADSLAEIPLFSFEAEQLPSEMHQAGATVSLGRGEGVTQGQQALRIEFPKDTGGSFVRFKADQPWDCTELGPCRLAFDVTNTGESSIHLRGTVKAAGGAHVKRSVSLPVGGPYQVYFELLGDGLTKDTGLRDDPPSLPAECGRKMIINGVKPKYAKLTKVRSFELHVAGTAQADTVVVDNLRIVANPPIIEGYMEGLVDRFGQSTRDDYPQKVSSEAELKRLADEELATLAEEGPMADRSRFGGWKEGPRLEATGYFRAEKVGDRWALVDPEGYLYFSNGLDNIRMANTSTFTGVDYRDDSVRYRDPEEVTPEDSLPIVPASAEAMKTAYVSAEWRRKMFTWLPEYGDPLAKYYGYRRSAHKGPLPHGEVFSFYMANLERRYGAETPEKAFQNWCDVTIDRMINWGFTSFGNWVDPAFYHANRYPYFANGWIIGEFKTVSSGNDYWGAMPDPFDPEFARRALVTTKVVAEEVRDNPWCVGIFIDNEKSWGNPQATKSHYGIVINTLPLDAAESPTKAAWVGLLKEKYDTIDALNAAWGSQIASWDAFAKTGYEWADGDENPKLIADFSMLLEAYADKYFHVVHDALEEVLPNHMYLGVRMTPWGMTPETRRAAARYADVMSYNYYREALGERDWGFLEEIDKPSLIGEFHMGATDAGLPHPGIVAASDQEDRGRMYKTYVESVIDNPYFVGVHCFQYIDSPLTGRAHDGENYNIGFVSTTDVPYAPMIKAAKEVNRDLYPRRYGPVTDR